MGVSHVRSLVIRQTAVKEDALVHDGEKLLPRLRAVDSAHVHVGSAALCVYEKRVRKFTGERRLTDTLTRINPDPPGAFHHAGLNIEHDTLLPT